MADLKKAPEFKALQAVLVAMAPLSPEGRRRVVEAVHALLEVSAGKKPSHGMRGPGPRKAKARRTR
jgi:hypothetical protein